MKSLCDVLFIDKLGLSFLTQYVNQSGLVRAVYLCIVYFLEALIKIPCYPFDESHGQMHAASQRFQPSLHLFRFLLNGLGFGASL